MATPTYSRGDVVFAKPSDLHDPTLPVTVTKPGGKIGMHPVIVLSVDATNQIITGVMVQTFSDAPTLAATSLSKDVYKWFLPVIPAPKESIHDPIPAPADRPNKPEWVRLIKSIIPAGDIKKPLGNVSEKIVTAIEAAIVAANK